MLQHTGLQQACQPQLTGLLHLLPLGNEYFGQVMQGVSNIGIILPVTKQKTLAAGLRVLLLYLLALARLHYQYDQRLLQILAIYLLRAFALSEADTVLCGRVARMWVRPSPDRGMQAARSYRGT